MRENSKDTNYFEAINYFTFIERNGVRIRRRAARSIC